MKITLRENGSIAIETDGSYTLQIGDGQSQLVEKPRLSLCRCGHSSNSPLCDGSHKSHGFIAPSAELEFNPPTS